MSSTHSVKVMSPKMILKVELGVAKGKKTHDKRETIKNRDAQKAIKCATGIKRK